MAESQKTEKVSLIREIAKSIDWLAGRYSDDEQIDFHSADWSRVDEIGEVVLEGYRGDTYVRAVVRIEKVETSYAPRHEDEWEDGDE